MMPSRKTCRTRVRCSISRPSQLITGLPPNVHRVYSMYFKMLDLNIDQYRQVLDPGDQAVANETDPNSQCFQISGRENAVGAPAAGMEAVGPTSDSKCDSVKG